MVQGLQDITKQGEHKMIKLVETVTHYGTTWQKRYYTEVASELIDEALNAARAKITAMCKVA